MLLTPAKSMTMLRDMVGRGGDTSFIGSKNNCWLGLLTAMPASDGTGYVEVATSGTSYNRENIYSKMTAEDSSNRAISNATDIGFPVCVNPSDQSAAATWGTIVGFGLFTSASGSNLYAWGALDESTSVTRMQALHFLAGDFKIFLDQSASASAST